MSNRRRTSNRITASQQPRTLPLSTHQATSSESVKPESSSLPPRPFDFPAFRKQFEKAYNHFYRFNKIDDDLLAEVTQHNLTEEQFDKLTLHKQYQRYVALIDGKVWFSEVPNKPHGEIAHLLLIELSSQLRERSPNGVLKGCGDNGIIPFLNVLTL
jgi:hypothetical protein